MERTIPKTSRKAFHAEERKKSAKEHKKMILGFLEGNTARSNRQLAEELSLNYGQVQKRTSDLMKEGRLSIAGTIEEDGYSNSLYQFESWTPKTKTRKTNQQLLLEAVRDVAPIFSDAIERRFNQLKQVQG